MNSVILKTIDIIMEFAPIGVFALLGAIIVDLKGDMVLFTALGWYALTVIVGLVIVAFVFYPLLLQLLTKTKPLAFFKAISPAQLLAFSTSSSAATLPVTMECCEKNLKISHEVSSFVLPIGATVNMDGTSLYQAVAAVFIATAFGIDLTFSQQLTIILTATLASIGSAAVPGAGMVMLVIVLNSVGVPSEGLALIFAIDRPLDMLRTTINVTGDMAVASIIQHFNRDVTSNV
jgi:Na+/H+-dicarboxylate symporter